MANLEIIKLKNGLKIFLVNDNTKHTTYINLVVKYGGMDNTFYLNNKKYVMCDGIAHMLEHTVLESNIYGDLMSMFGKLGIRSNGITYMNRTQYFIDTVDHIYDGLKVLIKGIHNPIINKEVLYNIKKPIIEEKRRSLDNKNRMVYSVSLTGVLNNKKYKTILGEISDIERISVNDLKLCFNTFYRPENEFIVIGGRFDKNKVLEVINNTYNELTFDTQIVKKYIYPNNEKVNKKKIIIKENTGVGKSLITFKINTNILNSKKMLEYDLFIASFLRMNFGIVSKIQDELVDCKVINGGISFSNTLIENNQIIMIGADTNYHNKLVNRIIKYIENKEYVLDEDLFNLYKRNYIIDLVLRNDNIYDTIDPLIENIVSYNYEKLDTIYEIEKLTYKSFVKFIEVLDFSNYSVCSLKNK